MRCKESAIALEFRDVFLVYLIGVGRFMEKEMGLNNRRVGSETYDHTRKPTKGKCQFGKGTMRNAEHSREGILGLRELTIMMKMGKLIMREFRRKLGLSSMCRGPSFMSIKSYRARFFDRIRSYRY